MCNWKIKINIVFKGQTINKKYKEKHCILKVRQIINKNILVSSLNAVLFWFAVYMEVLFPYYFQLLRVVAAACSQLQHLLAIALPGGSCPPQDFAPSQGSPGPKPVTSRVQKPISLVPCLTWMGHWRSFLVQELRVEPAEASVAVPHNSAVLPPSKHPSNILSTQFISR